MKKTFYLIFAVLLGLMFVGSGINHCLKPDFYLKMMPDYLPAHLFLVYVSGAIEIVLGVAFFFSPYRRFAAWGMIALMFAVFPANIHMYLHPELFPDVPPSALLIRLPIQAVFIFWAWIYTKEKNT